MDADCDCDCGDFCAGLAIGGCLDCSPSRSNNNDDGCGCAIISVIVIGIIVAICFMISGCDKTQEYKIIEVKQERRLFGRDGNTTIENVETGERRIVKGIYGQPGEKFKHSPVFE